MDNASLKSLAWSRLFTDGWFWRLFGGMILLGVCGSVVQSVISSGLETLSVSTWVAYLKAFAANRRDLTTPVPNLTANYVYLTTSATFLSLFFSLLVNGIASYGLAVLRLRCVRNDESGWLSAAFGGFKMPFGMFWLLACQVLIFAGWCLVALLPLAPAALAVSYLFMDSGLSSVAAMVGIAFLEAVCVCASLFILLVPFYRYRYLWLVKAEHPGWSAGRVVRACKDLMRGNVRRAVRLDMAYWKPLLLVCSLVFLQAGAALDMFGLVGGLAVALAVSLALFACLVILVQYVGMGQALLYRELADASEALHETGASSAELA